MHPRDFEVNRTWLAYRVNQLPIMVGADAVDIFILQDAGSMFIFGNAFAPHGAEYPSDADVQLLMEQAWSSKQEWPEEIVLPGKPSSSNSFSRMAQRNGVAVRAVAESQVSFYIKDAQTSFEEFLGREDERDA